MKTFLLRETETLEGASRDGDTITATAPIVTGAFNYLDPLSEYTVTVTVISTPNGGLTKVRALNKGGLIKNTGSLSLTGLATYGGNFKIYTTPNTVFKITITNNTAYPSTSRFGVLAYIECPELQSNVLGKAILGGFALSGAENTHAFKLGTSRLGEAPLAGETPMLKNWVQLASAGTQINLSRGVTFNNLSARADLGSLTIKIFNSFDPRTIRIKNGTPIILVDHENRAPLFTGNVSRVSSSEDKDGTYTVEISAVDKLSEVSKTAKYQDTRTNGAPWQEVIEALNKSFPIEIIQDPTATPTPLIGSIVKESNLAEYNDILCATVGVSWFVTKNNSIRFTQKLAEKPKIQILTSNTNYTGELPVVSPTSVQARYDSDQVISAIRLQNHSYTQDDEGNFQSKTTPTTITNEKHQRLTDNIVELETMSFNISELAPFFQDRLADYEPIQQLQSATFTTTYNYRQLDNTDLLLPLEICDVVASEYRGTKTNLLITRIEWNITPASAFLTLNFTPIRKD